MQFFESFDLVLQNGWTAKDVEVVTPRDIAGVAFVGNITEAAPEKFGPLARGVGQEALSN